MCYDCHPELWRELLWRETYAYTRSLLGPEAHVVGFWGTPPLLHTFPEPRIEALKHYQPHFSKLLNKKPIRINFEVDSLHVVDSCTIKQIVPSSPTAHLLNPLRYQDSKIFLNQTPCLLFNPIYEKFPDIGLRQHFRKLTSFRLREISWEDEPIPEDEQNNGLSNWKSIFSGVELPRRVFQRSTLCSTNITATHHVLETCDAFQASLG
jgi:hypothetical protein